MRTIKMIFCFIGVSLKKEYAYRFELLMTFVNLLFQLSFTIIFWFTLFQYIPALAGWSIKELLFYTSVVSLGEGIGGFFFGFRDMPERILNGEVDKYLVRPVNVMMALLFENVSVFYLLQQILVSFVIMGVIMIRFDIEITLVRVLAAVFVLVAGVLIIQFIIGIITFLTFWLGRIESLRNLFLSVLEVREYPLCVYPKSIQTLLSYFLPVSFSAYYPAAILLQKKEVTFELLGGVSLYVGVLFLIFQVVWRKGIKRYEANGG